MRCIPLHVFFLCSAEERDQCVTLRENVEQRYKRLEDEVGTLHVRLQQQTELKKQNGDLTESVTICKSELDSLNKLDATRSATLDTLRLEKDAMSTQLDVKKEENEKLKLDLEAVREFNHPDLMNIYIFYFHILNFVYTLMHLVGSERN